MNYFVTTINRVKTIFGGNGISAFYCTYKAYIIRWFLSVQSLNDISHSLHAKPVIKPKVCDLMPSYLYFTRVLKDLDHVGLHLDVLLEKVLCLRVPAFMFFQAMLSLC